MCGIAGIVRTDGRPVEAEVLTRMAARLRHRGPDDFGLWLEPEASAGLAVRRLAVIDPAGSRQPLSNEDGTVWLAYNGETYNFRALRADLEVRGHVFRTAGDTEVLVHLYEDGGPDFAQRLVGMFAAAVWDGRRRRLVLVRDRLGQKPIYWWHGPAGFFFASELAALFECPEVPRHADRRAIVDFLRFGYVPAPATGFAGVQKLPPAHRLTLDASSGRLDGPVRWWDIPRGPAETDLSRHQWRERLRDVLAQAVRQQLAADVPVGVLLSGGVDSSVVAALAAENTAGPIRTFTVRFAESGWDESAYARAVASRLGSEHTEVTVEPRCVEALEELVVHHGEPFADSSAVAEYYLAREARRQVTVALGGDGGDESFGGYPRHGAMILSDALGRRVRRVLASVGRRMPPRPGRKNLWNDARRFLAALDLEPLDRYLAWRSLFSLADLTCSCGGSDEPLLESDFAADVPPPGPPKRWIAAIAGLDSRPWVDRVMAIDLLDYLPDDCLAKVDIASMASSLEVRSPMVDHEVVELGRRMPAELKWRRRTGRTPLGKAILRETFCDLLPPEVLTRGKMGFGVPVGRWLAGPCAEWMRAILLDATTLNRGIVNPRAAASLIEAHLCGRADRGEQLWALACLELWMRAFRL